MNSLWSDHRFSEWLWVQLRMGLRQRHVYRIPRCDEPHCSGGLISTRHWLGRPEANAAAAFGTQLLRGLVDVIADDGTVPLNSWLRRWWQIAALQPNRKRLMHSNGENNAVALTCSVDYPNDVFPPRYLETAVLPALARTPAGANLASALTVGRHGTGEVGWTVQLMPLTTPGISRPPNSCQLVVSSPVYYCRHRQAGPPQLISWRWPLDPEAERLPVAANPAWRRMPTRSNVAARAEEAVGAVRSWAEFLGYRVGAVGAAQWGQDRPGWWVYRIAAPVDVLVAPEEMARRAAPYSGAVDVMIGSRDPRPGGFSKDRFPLVRFGYLEQMRVEINDVDGDGRFALEVRAAGLDRGRPVAPAGFPGSTC